MVDRGALYDAIIRSSMKMLTVTKSLSEMCNILYQKYNIPLQISSDILTFRTDIRDALDVILFCIAKEFKLHLFEYFTAEEINQYEDYQYEESTVVFPYIFENMVEISEGKQYIGKITAQQLMRLRDAQIINYNTNTQRQMQLKTGNNFNYFRIALNRKAVNQIIELLKAKDFIPNTITLNINPATDYSYSNGKLKIREEVKFDILDGYHRYIALSNMYNLNNDFDYPMELRVTFFREEIARQFIFQEDQKTKLAKVDSDAMNKNNISNKICREILEMIKDNFNATDIIRQGVLSKMISILYIDKGQTYSFAKINAITNEIFKAIKMICIEAPELMDTVWSNSFIIVLLTLIKQDKYKGKELYEKATELSKKVNLNIGVLTLSKLNEELIKKGGEEYAIQ